MKWMMPSLAILLLLVQCTPRRERNEAQGMPVSTEVVKPSAFTASTTLIGTVRPAAVIPVATNSGGFIAYPPRFAHGLRTGDTVRKGERLATMTNQHVLLELSKAKLEHGSDQASLERTRRSFEQGLSSRAELSRDELRAQISAETLRGAQADAARLELVADRAGKLIVSRTYAPGTELAPGTKIADLATTDALVVEALAPASIVRDLTPGLRFELALSGSGAKIGRGTIREVAAVLDEAGAARVVGTIDETSQTLTPGVGVEMSVAVSNRPDVLTVPEEAIVAGSDGASVFVITGGGVDRVRVKRVAVETGGRANGRVEVLRGLQQGDRVVVSGADALSDGAMVVVVQPGGAA